MNLHMEKILFGKLFRRFVNTKKCQWPHPTDFFTSARTKRCHGHAKLFCECTQEMIGIQSHPSTLLMTRSFPYHIPKGNGRLFLVFAIAAIERGSVSSWNLIRGDASPGLDPATTGYYEKRQQHSSSFSAPQSVVLRHGRPPGGSRKDAVTCAATR